MRPSFSTSATMQWVVTCLTICSTISPFVSLFGVAAASPTRLNPTTDEAHEFVRSLVNRAPSSGQRITPARAQVRDTVDLFSRDRQSGISSYAVDLPVVQDQLRSMMKSRRDKRLKVMWVQGGGSNGDIATLSSLLEALMADSQMFRVDHAFIYGPSWRNFFPKSLRSKFAKDNREWDRDQSRTQDTQGLLKAMDSAIKSDPPDVIVTSYLAWRDFRPEWPEFQKLLAPQDGRVIIDLYALFMSTSIRQDGSAARNLNPRKLRVYAQEPSIWGVSSPNQIGGTMIGKLPSVSGSSEQGGIPGDVAAWIAQEKKRSRNVMYLGIGGMKREEDKQRPTPPFARFARREIKNRDDWSYIIFHNVAKPSDAPRTSDNGRICHLYYGEADFASLFDRIDLILTHGGIGSYTDAIMSNIPQIIMPLQGTAPDQQQLGERAEHMGIGKLLPAITVDQLTGKDPNYPIDRIQTACREISNHYKTYVEKITPLQAILKKTQAGRNGIELITRLSEGALRHQPCRRAITEMGATAGNGTSCPFHAAL